MVYKQKLLGRENDEDTFDEKTVLFINHCKQYCFYYLSTFLCWALPDLQNFDSSRHLQESNPKHLDNIKIENVAICKFKEGTWDQDFPDENMSLIYYSKYEYTKLNMVSVVLTCQHCWA